MKRANAWGLVLAAALLSWGCGGDADLDQPVPLYGSEPIAYPLDLWDEGAEGVTVLRVRVTDTGAVDSVEVVETSGHEGLDAAAVEGARDLRFEPGRQGGNRVSMWANIPIEFSRRP